MTGRRSWLELVEILGLRFDAHSARAVLDETLDRIGIAKKATYLPDEIARVAGVLAHRRDRLVPVVQRLAEEARRAAAESRRVA